MHAHTTQKWKDGVVKKLKQHVATALAVFLIVTPAFPVHAETDLSAAPSETSQTEVMATPSSSEVVLDTPTEAVDKSQEDVTGETSTDNVKEEKEKGVVGEDPQPEALMSGESSSIETGLLPSTIKQDLPQSDLEYGSLRYNYPIVIPPGRSGLQPDLALVYASHANKEGGIFGSGWSLSVPYIERINRKGIDKLYTESYFTSSLDGEFVVVSGSAYRAKVENGKFIDYSLSGNIWTVKDKDGTVYKFGTNASERQDDPVDSSKVFKWMLQEVRDTNNNYIKYEYYKDGGQIYPSKIKYTGNASVDGIFEVEFLRESRSDINTSYETGFSVVTSFRIYEIQIKVNGSWIRKYSLSFTTARNGRKVLLNTIINSGRDGTEAAIALPAIDYDYQTGVNTWTSGSWTSPVDVTEGVIIADANGDGLPDLLQYDDRNGIVKRAAYINTGSGWSANTTWDPPSAMKFYVSGTGDMGVRAVDINGDAKVDLIQSEPNNKRVYLNNGAGWTQDTSWDDWPSSFLFVDGSGTYSDGATRILDVNGDGLPDFVKAKTNSTTGVVETWLAFHNGTGWTTVLSGEAWSVNTPWTIPNDLREGVIEGDINGDGLADFVQHAIVQGNTKRTAHLNTGSGWLSNSSYTPSTDLLFYKDNETDQDKGVRGADINADGLMDLIQSNSVYKRAFINTGGGWGEDTNWDNWPSGMKFVESNGFDGGTRTLDLDGDGVVDLLKSIGGSTPTTTTSFNVGATADLLKKISYPEGGYSDIAYKATPLYMSGGSTLNPSLPFVFDTLHQITNNSNFGVTSTYTYSYEGGKYYFGSSTDRKFAGFGKVTRTDAVGNKTVTYYHQGDTTNSSLGEYDDHASKIGKVYRTENLDSSGNKYHVTINKWDRYNQATGRDFVKLTQSIDFTYDGNSTHKDKASSYTYDDATGNLTQKIDWGEVAATDSGTFTDALSDKLTTDVSYAANSTAYIYLPKTETATDQSANKVRESKYYYDSSAHGTVTKGNLTKQEKWKSGSSYITLQKSYNSTYGTLATETDARGKVTTYTLDSYNLYPATVAKPHSLSVQYTYDYSSGKPKQTTDENGLVYQTIYDGLDRVVEEKQPDLSTPATLVTRTSYTYTDTSGSVSVLRRDYLDASNIVDTYTYFDGFARPIQTRREMEDSGNFAVSDTIYNNIEQVHKESLPYTSSGYSRTTATSNNDLLTTYTYDPLARVVSVQNAVGTVSTTFDDWKTIVTDARGKSKNLYKDAYGQLTKVEELNSGSTYTTTYTYNGNGNLTSITDALSNVRNFTYDGLGRRLTAQDLHASGDGTYGTWTYTYDDSGNLTQSTDPKSQTINYTYDDVNRQLTEDYTGVAGTEVTYAYDSCTYGKPKLCTVTKSDGVNTSYSYNANGSTASEVKTIQATDYTTSFSYDRQGNQLEVTYPDNSKAKYTYNAGGLPETVQRKENGDSTYSNLVTDMDYGPHGKLTYQANSNSTTTTNTYDSAKLYRLTSKVTSNGSNLQNFAYTYDANGNITKIVDTSATNAAKTVDYTYDDLNRLLSATSSSAANGQNYTRSYTYSAIGNILTGDAGTYSYSGTGHTNPHAVTSTSSGSYTYDANGNQTEASSGSSTIAVDTTSTSITSGYAGGPVTKTWTHTTGSGSNRLLVLSADIWQDTAGTGTVTAASYNGVALTKVTNTRSGGMASEIWYLVNPTSGANTVSVTVTGATDAIKLSASTFTGVDQTSPLAGSNVATGTSGNPSVSLTTTSANSLVLSTLSRFSTTAATSNRTSLYNNTAGSILGAASYQLTTTTGSYSDTYTGSSNNDWSMVTAEFKPASTSSTTHTYNYKNQLTQTVKGSTTVQYDYDHTGQRARLYNGTANTHYPNKYYNAAGTTETKHIFTPSGELLADVQKTASSSSTISPDTTSTSITSGYAGGPVAKTWTHTTGTSSNRLLILTASIWQDTAGTGSITSASYNGTALTKVTSTRSGGMSTEVWYLTNPPSGANTVSVTVTGATDAIKLSASTYSGVTQTSPLDASNTSTGTSGNPTVSLTTTTANDLVLAALSRFSTTAATSNKTSLYNNTAGSILGASSYQLSTTAGSYSDTYTGSSNNDWSMVITSFKPATTTGGTTVRYIHTDHLTGSSVITNTSGTVDELMDYYPYGGMRLDEKAGTFSEQRKYASSEYDTDTGLNYMNARYYDSGIGRFTSQDSVHLAMGDMAAVKSITGFDPEFLLVDPQQLNSYAYARNNPLRYVDLAGGKVVSSN